MQIETVATDPLAWVADRLQDRRRLSAARRAVVLVPAERHAHVVRRRLCVDLDRAGCLAGVSFLRPAEFARTLLLHGGVARSAGWEDVRLVRLRHLFEAGELHGRLRYFRSEQLRSGRGYGDAFARTIVELEASNLTVAETAVLAAQLRSSDTTAANRLHDVAMVWAAADAGCGPRRTANALLRDAAELSVARPDLVGGFGDTFAVLTHSPSAALLQFLDALPGCRVVLAEARPLRAGTQRWRGRAGLPAVVSPGRAGASRRADAAPPSELDLLRDYLFQVPEILARADRPRSAAPDGTVDLEDHAGLEEEIDAAVGWVVERVLAGTPVEEIGLIVPDMAPYAGTIIDRLRRVASGATGTRPAVYVAGGIPLAETAAGRRFGAVVQALGRGLEVGATIRLLPALRRGPGQGGGRERLSLARAAQIVYEAGIPGGSPGDLSGVAQWLPRLQAQCEHMRAVAEAVPAPERVASGAAPLPRAAVRSRHDAERWLRDVEPMLPALAALQELAEAVGQGAPLTLVWARLRDLCQRWLWIPPEPSNLLPLLTEALRPVFEDASAGAVTGPMALDVVREALRRVRVPIGRFGDPALFLGTASEAAGLSFSAVRVLGLAEGALPHTPHDDPILPDAVRGDLEATAMAAGRAGVVVPRLADRVLDETHDVFRVIVATRQAVALSAPRQWADRSEREVSGVVLEVATALGRPAAGGTDDGDVPTAARLRAAYLTPGRMARRRGAECHPATPRARLRTVRMEGAAPAPVAVPHGWMAPPVLAVDAVTALGATRDSDDLAALDGVVSEAWGDVPPAGLVPRRPLSATGLALLLGCPHRFLLERVLFLHDPPAAPATDAIAPATYGALFHAAAEACFREMGPALCRRIGALSEWTACARAIAATVFEARRHEYPMRGAESVARERARLQEQIAQLVGMEWEAGPREFLASELVFGDPDPVGLAVGADIVYVRGAVDRVDRDDRYGLSVRDLKTGRVRDFGDEPVGPGRDLQIGLYVLALERLGYGEAAVGHAAYVHPASVSDGARAFVGADLEMLRRQTREWLGVAAGLLRTGAFPRTPNGEDCALCPFLPACGPDAHRRSASKLARHGREGALAAFVALKRRRADEDAA